MNDDKKRMIAYMAVSGIATLLYLIIIMVGYNNVFVKVSAGINLLMFLLAGTGSVQD